MSSRMNGNFERRPPFGHPLLKTLMIVQEVVPWARRLHCTCCKLGQYLLRRGSVLGRPSPLPNAFLSSCVCLERLCGRKSFQGLYCWVCLRICAGLPWIVRLKAWASFWRTCQTRKQRLDFQRKSWLSWPPSWHPLRSNPWNLESRLGRTTVRLQGHPPFRIPHIVRNYWSEPGEYERYLPSCM